MLMLSLNWRWRHEITFSYWSGVVYKRVVVQNGEPHESCTSDLVVFVPTCVCQSCILTYLAVCSPHHNNFVAVVGAWRRFLDMALGGRGEFQMSGKPPSINKHVLCKWQRCQDEKVFRVIKAVLNGWPRKKAWPVVYGYHVLPPFDLWPR